MFLYKGNKFNPDIERTIGDTQYPAGWFRVAAHRDAIGVTEVADPVRPDERFNYISENSDGSLTVTPKDIETLKPSYKDQIDQLCGSKRSAVVSSGDYISEEYRRAYEDALLYKNAGYIGTVPNSVQSWSTASGMTAQSATDDIIATRNGYMALLDAVRAIRLSGKSAIDAATTPNEILAVLETVNSSLGALS